jgi:hypothetical protein
MGADLEGPMRTKVYATKDGRAVIEQSQGSVALNADEILAIIDELHVCYDYCVDGTEARAHSR